MSSNNKLLSHISPYKLNEIYYTLFEMQLKLGISDECLFSTDKLNREDDIGLHSRLGQLLEASEIARDNILTWYLKQTYAELNVTLSLLTAKIKLMRYKLCLCDGLDLHQACSLSLVDFCNILADLTVSNLGSAEKKTLHMVSAENNIPVWLSHYRNLICHMPSESPCIAILVPLVEKSLAYMKESFWSKVVEHESFDEKRFKKVFSYLSKQTNITCVDKRLQLKKNSELSQRRTKNVILLDKCQKVCVIFRRFLVQNPQKAVDSLVKQMISNKFEIKKRNTGLILAQLIYAKRFERFVFRLISLTEQNPSDTRLVFLLKRIIRMISGKNRSQLRENLIKMDIDAIDLARFIDISPIKCCRIAYRLMKLDGPVFRLLLVKLHHRLLPVLGKQNVSTLLRMTKVIAYKPQ